MTQDKTPIDLEREKINLETGRLTWPELERFFARGVIIVIDQRLDLVEAAAVFSRDDKQRVQQWIDNKLIVRAHDEHALRWQNGSYQFWSVVAAPWVLVQEIVVQ